SNDTLTITGADNKYPFHTLLQPSERPVETLEKRLENGYTELWYKAKANKIIVVARKKADVLEAMTLFSYIFCVFLFLVGFFNALVLLLRMGGDISEFR